MDAWRTPSGTTTRSLWQNGGSILNEDNTQAAFNSPEGVEALEVLTGMAVEDESVFLDLQNSPYTGCSTAGRSGCS